MTPSEGATRRLHPTSIVFNLAREAKSLAAPAVLLFFGSRGRDSGAYFWAFMTAAGALTAMGVAIARYFSFTYTYEADELVVREGLFFKRERHIPYSRIQNIDATQNIVHAVFDVYAVALETGSGAEAEATLSVLPASALTEMRRRVFEGRRAADAPEAMNAAADESDPTPAPAPGPAPAGEVLLHLGLRDLAICGLVRGRGLLLLAAIFGVAADIMGDFDIDEKVIETAENEQRRGPIVRAVRTFASGFSFDPWHILVAGTLLLIVLGFLRLCSMLYMMQKLHDFRLVLIEGELRVSFGLLTRVKATIPMRRIQAITVREGPLHRLFGVCSVRADTAGGAADLEAARSREWLAPVIKRADMPAFVRRVMPEADIESLSWQPAHPRAIRRVVVRPLIYTLVVSAVLVWPMGVWAALPAVLLVALVLFRASRIVRHMGHALHEEIFAFKSGWLWRHMTVAPVRKVQAVAMHESPFDRRHGMAGLHVDTAGAAGGPHTLDVPFLPRATAAALSAALAGTAAESPLSW